MITWTDMRLTVTENIELLDQPPWVLARPLVLLHGRAYAAAWPFLRHTVAARSDKAVARRPRAPLPTARVETRQALWVIRDDGCVFGDGAEQPLAALGLDVRLGARPPNDRQ